MGGGAVDLAGLVGDELSRPVPAQAARLAQAIREQLGDATAAVVFYGSCLRRQTHEGVLDFYVLVDGYSDVYRSRWLAWANAVLPPNVVYIEHEEPEGTLRAKYAVMSTADFERAAEPGRIRPGVWARFCQPALLVYARDAAAREAVVRAGVRSILTLVERALPLLPSRGDRVHFTPAAFWQRAFRETYAEEMRPEAPAKIRELYDAAPERYDRAAQLALAELAQSGTLGFAAANGVLEVTLPAEQSRRARRTRRLRRPLAKLVYAAQLLKTAATFGDWLPYALWKVERHTGTRFQPSERQRRHPLIWGWPLLFRLLWSRDLR